MIQDADFLSHHPPECGERLTGVPAAWMMENDFEPFLGHKFRFQSNSHSG